MKSHGTCLRTVPVMCWYLQVDISTAKLKAAGREKKGEFTLMTAGAQFPNHIRSNSNEFLGSHHLPNFYCSV